MSKRMQQLTALLKQSRPHNKNEVPHAYACVVTLQSSEPLSKERVRELLGAGPNLVQGCGDPEEMVADLRSNVNLVVDLGAVWSEADASEG